ncbi:MAG TPA: hypothetical protein VNV82_07640 [Bryobacteraceae bacterium]|nr:hypothetical protein [Bryobacteraceae bacterium]
MLRLVNDDPPGVAPVGPESIGTPNLSSFLEQYRPMLKLLSAADVNFLSRQQYSHVGHFRRERAAIYFQYLGELCRDLRALPLWMAPNDGEAFIELDKASWLMQKMLVKLALEGVLYYIGIPRRDSGRVQRCFERLGSLLSAAA